MPESPQLVDDAVVLSLVLGLPCAETRGLLAEAGSLRELVNGRESRLASESDLAARIRAVHELVVRYCRRWTETPRPSFSLQQVSDYLVARIGTVDTERVLAFALDGADRIIDDRVVGYGTVDRAVAFPREVAVFAFTRKASGVVVAHNHPSGNPTPSDQDLRLTRAVERGLATLGIRLVDHLVVTVSDVVSMREAGLL